MLKCKMFNCQVAMMNWANSNEGTEYIISINYVESTSMWNIFYIDESTSLPNPPLQ